MQPGEARKQRRPELGPVGELAPDRGLAAFEELAQGRRVAQLLVAGERIGAEQVDQKGRQLARLVALGSRGVALPGDDGGLAHGKNGEGGEQESDHGRGADADAVPAGKLAQAVGCALGPGADRPAGAGNGRRLRRAVRRKGSGARAPCAARSRQWCRGRPAARGRAPEGSTAAPPPRARRGRSPPPRSACAGRWSAPHARARSAFPRDRRTAACRSSSSKSSRPRA